MGVGGWVGQTCWPTFQKKLIKVTAAPQRIAAPQETRTPTFPREARCGLELLAPNPHTTAETMSARTERISPTVIKIGRASCRERGARQAVSGWTRERDSRIVEPTTTRTT